MPSPTNTQQQQVPEYTVLSDIEKLAGCTPAEVWEGFEQTSIVNSADENRNTFAKP
jgi:hypothetical protein